MPADSRAPHLPVPDFAARRRRVLDALSRDGSAGVLVIPAAPLLQRSRDTEIRYRPDSDLVYLTGFTEPDAVLVLVGGAEPHSVLFTRARDAEAELWSGPRLGPDGAVEMGMADEAHHIEVLDEVLAPVLEAGTSIHYRLGASGRVDELVRRALAYGRGRGQRSGAGPRAVMDPGLILDEMRLRKDEAELARMRLAAGASVEGHRRAAALLAPGVGEWEVEAVLNATFRAAAPVAGPAYETIVGSGTNACVLHYVANRRRVEDGDLVLVDAGAHVDHYCGDITRTYPASGRFSPEQRAVYEVVENARAAAVAAVAPGRTVAEVHDTATRVLVEGLVELGVLEGAVDDLMEEEAHKAYYPHQTSHWLGLDVHDVGAYAVDGASRVLEPGMVLTVEPGLYFRPRDASGDAPDTVEAGEDRAARFRGIGVRLEDDVLVVEDGAEVLTAALPSDLEAVEALVREEAP